MKEKLKNFLGVYYFTRIKFFLRGFICYKLGDNYFAYLNRRFQSDKCQSHYHEFYTDIFRGLRLRKLKILEIGIGGHQEENFLGGSLLLWNKYFPRSQVFGIDLSRKNLFNRYRRIQTFEVDQSNSENIEAFAKKNGPFDIIIDDGSHFTDHILITFNVLYKHLNSNGYYFIEDMGTTYMKSFSGEPDINKNSEFFKKIMLLAKMTSRNSLGDELNELKDQFSKLHSVVFGDNMVIIRNTNIKSGSYHHAVSPWIDRDELRTNKEWIQSNDAAGRSTEKLDSGQMGVRE